MAKRLATEYVSAKLQLSSDEMSQFARFFDDQQIRLQVKVFDNGNQELILEDAVGMEEVKLTFERQQERYECVLSCRLVHPKLTNAMRKAVSAFHGDAIVNRIYSQYTMTYYYMNGNVRRIVENSPSGAKVVFDYKNTAGQLETVFRSRLIESEIETIHNAINELLDLRNQASDRKQVAAIDERLAEQTHKLFVLEA
ncbi:non-ribosomal peptide synthetase module [Paenibacillus sp. NPDC058071]|uniref:non-ribosomal peptide synthetase module n=1 Tax=Paenibacillus sp. NPDC058071 TaxID=3346326 RepID=UPI0036DC09B0